MPIIRSAKKALRQSQRHAAKNRKVKEAVRIAVKAYQKLVANKSIEEAGKLLSRVYQVLDKAAKRGVIKPNKAARLKSRLSQLIAKSRRVSS